LVISATSNMRSTKIKPQEVHFSYKWAIQASAPLYIVTAFSGENFNDCLEFQIH
jgi:hypothetical protein